ncbi:hypothetical protein DFH09DRAFT_1069401 [Mycena vulgaris]|nr:hypothetical protein DFH09DRAFT_1069401 [Mycena vulgaris]
MCPPSALWQLDVRLAQNIVIVIARGSRRIRTNWDSNSTQPREGRKKDYILWKQYVRRIEAVASQHHKIGTQKSQGPRDYEVEWEGYKDRKREELQRRVAHALYKENEDTVEMVELVSGPHANAPGPGVYPSRASAQQVCEDIPCGGGIKYSSYEVCISAWHAGCNAGEHEHPTKSQPSPLHHSSPQTPRHPKNPTASEATTPASALAPPASPTPTGLHYAMRGGGVVYGSIMPALAHYTTLQASTGAASLLTTGDPHHAAHFAAGHDHKEAQALANGERVVDRLLARPVFRLGSSPLHVLAEHGQTLIWELRDVLQELTIAPHEGEDSDDLLGDNEDTVSLTSIHTSSSGQNEDF